MKRMKIVATALLIAIVATAIGFAAVPKLVNYQGLLTDNTGSPVADATYEVTFRIYDETSTQRWSEIHNISTTNGLFSVQLGSNGSPLGEEIFDYTECWLGITVTGSSELSPRTRIGAVPYSSRTSTVDGASGGEITGPVQINLQGLSTGTESNIAMQIGNAGIGDRVIGIAGGAAAQYDMSGDIIGVQGWARGPMGGHKFGVRGFSDFTSDDHNNYGVYGEAVGMNGVYGVFGTAPTDNPNSYAGYFSGNVHVTGHLTGGALVSQIDHPSNPDNMYLQLSAIESPELKTVYDGVVLLDIAGEAVVTLPTYTDALNTNFTYQLTCVGGYAPIYVKSEISEGAFIIAGGTAGLKVCWQVSGVRKDAFALANPLQVEMLKADKDKGQFCHPDAFGKPETESIDYKLRSEPPDLVKK